MQIDLYLNTEEQRGPLIARVMRAARGPERDVVIFCEGRITGSNWLEVTNMPPFHPTFFYFALSINTASEVDVIVGRIRSAVTQGSALVSLDSHLFDGPNATELWHKLGNLLGK